MKIRNKLAFLFAVIVASLLLGFSVTVYFTLASYRKQAFYERLEDKAVTTAELLFDDDGVDPHLLKLFDKKNITTLDQEEITLYDSLDRIVYDSGHDHINISKPLFQRIRSQKSIRFRQGENEIVGVLFLFDHHPYVVIASAVDLYGKNKLDFLALVLLIGWLLSIGIVIALGFSFAGKALQPMAEVIDQMDRITASNLNSRVQTGNGKDEIAQLALIFNRMLARLEEAFLFQKSFVSNASHEIRTPLTAITGQIEVTLLQDRNGEEYRSVLGSVLEDVRTITHLANGLLELTQASADVSTFLFTEIRVDELLWQAQAELLKKQPGYTVAIDFDGLWDDEADCILMGSEPLLRIAFLNLMENGCKFSSDRQVGVLLKVERSRITLRFTDHGLGIEEKDLAHIFEPFYRSANAKHITGHGVGLALTARVIGLHRGRIEVASQTGQGSTFTVVLPHGIGS
ncbi:MAG: HAMP domain-containing sensor histidine kinase [Bacteroidota bacterium]